MSEGLIIQHCSPTLAGMKPGSMFSCVYPSEEALTEYIQGMNRRLGPKGIRAMVLRRSGNHALIYLFRPKAVEKVLKDRQAADILARYGYKDMKLEPCIGCLLGRFREDGEFPHEIGLFLGYPPEDVRGFIENKACNQKCVGCWKVYGDQKAAEKTFAKYKKCTDIYYNQWANGKSIDRLTVAG